MENYKIAEDLTVMLVSAKTFPDGVQAAFQQLEKLLPAPLDRPFYSVSWLNETGKIIYNAAAPEIKSGEASALDLETFRIEKGNYLTETITDFMKNPQQIRQAFERLRALPEVNKEYPCLEYYKSGKEVICLVRKLQQD